MNQEPKLNKFGKARCGRKPLGRVTLTTRPMKETADIIRARALAERKTPGEIMDEMFAPTPEPGPEPAPSEIQTGSEFFSPMIQCEAEPVTVNGDVTAPVLPVESVASESQPT